MKKQIIIGLVLFICGALQAQGTGSYLNFNVGGGVHNLSYTLLGGSEKGQFGYTLNAGYSYFFTPKWGVQTGVGFQSFNSLSTINYLSSTPDIDSDGQSYVFRSNYTNWQEKQQALFVDVPLSVLYRLPVTKKFGILTSLGGKVSMPVNTSYKTVGGQFETTGYYEKWNVVLDDMPQHGFSTFTKRFTGNTSLKTSYMAIADLGGLYKISDKVDLYLGGYINYGLNNVLKVQNKPMYQSSGVYNGVLGSSQTNSVTPISFGLKVGLYLGLGDKKPVFDFEKPIEPVQPVQPVQPIEPVKPVQPVQAEQAEQPVQTVQPVQPAEPKNITPVAPVIPQTSKVTDVPKETPKVIDKEVPKEITKEVPKETVKDQSSIQTSVKPDSVQYDPLKRAQEIAASMKFMFRFNSVRVRHARNDKIKELSDILKANPYINLCFVGHTCNVGSHSVNLVIGLKRAINVKRKLINQGVPKSQLIGESKSYDQPLVPNTTRANRAKNRRVEIKVFVKK